MVLSIVTVLIAFAGVFLIAFMKGAFGGGFAIVGNATKAVPWLLLVKPTAEVWTMIAICLPAVPAGVWLGWRVHGRLDQRQIYRACYALLVITALKLLWDGVSGYLT